MSLPSPFVFWPCRRPAGLGSRPARNCTPPSHLTAPQPLRCRHPFCFSLSASVSLDQKSSVAEHDLYILLVCYIPVFFCVFFFLA